jgi:hypothetical protein
MKVKQLIELLCQFNPETTVIVTYPSEQRLEEDTARVDTRKIHVEELMRYDGIHPLISVDGVLDLED